MPLLHVLSAPSSLARVCDFLNTRTAIELARASRELGEAVRARARVRLRVRLGDLDRVPGRAARFFSRWPSVKELLVRDGSGDLSLRDLSPLAALVGLQSLTIVECDGIRDLSPLAALVGLQIIRR